MASLLLVPCLAFAGCGDDDRSAEVDAEVTAPDTGSETDDSDGDGFDACDGGSDSRCDCDDDDASIHPDALETCTVSGASPADENCNLLVDELSECLVELDLDRDGFVACGADPGPDCDCNDCDPGIHPAAPDACGDGIDADCSGMDVPCSPEDIDMDNVTAAGGDCDDMNPESFPAAPERCGDGVDQDCGGDGDGACMDVDGDGWAEDSACDGDATVNPGTAEACNGVDDDCDGVADEVLAEDRGCVVATAPLEAEGCTIGRSCEIDFASSLLHCGGCRVACNPGSEVVADTCRDGQCDCSADPGMGACGSGEVCCPTLGCTDLLTDPASCGTCGSVCATGLSCVGGACTP